MRKVSQGYHLKQWPEVEEVSSKLNTVLTLYSELRFVFKPYRKKKKKKKRKLCPTHILKHPGCERIQISYDGEQIH